tara:strand:- start:207 stop:479 length:273 start_codon:yes stop_codon:yes gene_type:complete
MNPMREATLQVVSLSTSSAASSAFGSNVEYIRIVSTAACYITFGTSPTATTSKTYLPANEIEYWKVSEGQKVAAILGSSTASLYISELTE